MQIERGEIFATINQGAGMVSFDEDPKSFSSSALDERIQKGAALSQRIKTLDEEISSSSDYLARVSACGNFILEESAIKRLTFFFLSIAPVQLNGADRFLHDDIMFGDVGERPSRGKLTRVFDFLRG